MRWFLFAATAMVLSGCALPPAISIASLAFDFASYGATGKTVTGHGLSLVLQRDCSLLRGLEGEVCVEADSESASKKPSRELETRSSRRMVYLEEEHNRLMPHGMNAVETDVELALDSVAFITDPNVAPRGSGPLNEVSYLSDGDLPQDEILHYARLGGTAYLAQGLRGSYRIPDRTPGS